MPRSVRRRRRHRRGRGTSPHATRCCEPHRHGGGGRRSVGRERGWPHRRGRRRCPRSRRSRWRAPSRAEPRRRHGDADPRHARRSTAGAGDGRQRCDLRARGGVATWRRERDLRCVARHHGHRDRWRRGEQWRRCSAAPTASCPSPVTWWSTRTDRRACAAAGAAGSDMRPAADSHASRATPRSAGVPRQSSRPRAAIPKQCGASTSPARRTPATRGGAADRRGLRVVGRVGAREPDQPVRPRGHRARRRIDRGSRPAPRADLTPVRRAALRAGPSAAAAVGAGRAGGARGSAGCGADRGRHAQLGDR